MDDFEAIIVGGGHNGLTASAYLARAGLRTLVLERRPVIGGAAVTEEIHAGFRTSTLSYICGMLHPQIIRDLQLERHGFEVIPLAGTMIICADGRELLLTDNAEERQEAIARYSSTDYAALMRYNRIVDEAATVVRGQWLREPPRLSSARLVDLGTVLRLGGDWHRMQPEAREMLSRALVGSAKQIIERWFESDMMRLFQAANMVTSNFTALDAPGSALSLLRHGIQSIGGGKHPWGVVRGGMGAISGAIAATAREHGADIRTRAGVAQILTEDNKAIGVRLDDGSVIRARIVLSSATPKRTFLELMGTSNLEPDFAADLRGYRMGTANLKINLALNGLPRYRNDPANGASDRHRALVHLVESIDSIDASFRRASAGEIGDPATAQIVIPSILDDSLAPRGQHVASIACRYYPYDLAGGRSWDDVREATADRVLGWVERYVPGLRDLIIARHVLTPLDLEREYGLTRGDMHHGRLDPDQVWNMRPHPEAAQYRTPIKNLYLCGAGTHPGGGVTGAPGHNAAQRVLRDRRHFQ